MHITTPLCKTCPLSILTHYNDKGLWKSPDLSFSRLSSVSTFPKILLGENCRHYLHIFSPRLITADLCRFIFMVVKGHSESSCITSDSDSSDWLLKSAFWSYDMQYFLHCASVSGLITLPPFLFLPICTFTPPVANFVLVNIWLICRNKKRV